MATVPVTVLPGGVRPTEPQLVYIITNAGRRSVFVSHFGGIYRDGKSFEVVPRTSPWPKELRPGESVSERAEDPVRVLLSNGGVRALGAWDTTGRFSRISRRDLSRLKVEAKRLQGTRLPTGQQRGLDEEGHGLGRFARYEHAIPAEEAGHGSGEFSPSRRSPRPRHGRAHPDDRTLEATDGRSRSRTVNNST